MALRRRALFLVAALLLLLLTSCIARSRIGVQAGAKPGSIAIRIVLCRSSDSVSVTRVSLIRPGTKDASFDERGATTLWQIQSSGTNVSDFVVGQTPSGFDERVPLSSLPNPADTLTAVVDAGVVWYDYFQAQMLRPNAVIYEGKPVSDSAFVKQARSGGGCSRDFSTGTLLLRLGALIVIVAGLAILIRRGSKRSPPHATG